MLTLTYDTILQHEPCWLDNPGGEQRLREACDRLGGTFTAVDVLRADWASARDRIWVVTQPGVLPDRVLQLFAARTARRALERERAAGREPHLASWAAVETAERHARWKATDEELNAAWMAANDAVAAAQTAARAAARAAADAAWAAARAAADTAWGQARTAAAWAADSAVAAAAWAAEASDAAEAAWEAGCAEPHAQVADLLELLREAEPGDGRED